MKTMYVAVVLPAVVAMVSAMLPPMGRPGGLPGGFPPLGGLTPANLSDPVIVNLTNFAVGQLGADYTLNNITAAHTQVVSGTMYHLELLVTKAINGFSPKTMTCDVKVHEQVWMNFQEVTEHCCRLHVNLSV